MNNPKCIAVCTTDGQVLAAVNWKRHAKALRRWDPGTWLGRGDTIGQATQHAMALAKAYKNKRGDWRPFQRT
jgi:hypothetical protein